MPSPLLQSRTPAQVSARRAEEAASRDARASRRKEQEARTVCADPRKRARSAKRAAVAHKHLRPTDDRAVEVESERKWGNSGSKLEGKGSLKFKVS